MVEGSQFIEHGFGDGVQSEEVTTGGFFAAQSEEGGITGVQSVEETVIGVRDLGVAPAGKQAMS